MKIGFIVLSCIAVVALSEESNWSNDMGNVKVVTDETWSATVGPDAKDRRFLAFFYAPWCGHCKAAKPEYVAASLETDIKMIAVDCTASGQETCDDQEVSGYPTLKYFDLDSDNVVEDYKAARNKLAFLKFLQKRNPNYVPPPLESVSNPWGEEGSGRVVHLTDDHFENFRVKQKRFLLMMHAPWCGHCKAAKPDFVAASKRFLKRTFRFAAIDCTEDGAETCAALGVKSYPTFLYVFASTNPREQIREKMTYHSQITDTLTRTTIRSLVLKPQHDPVEILSHSFGTNCLQHIQSRFIPQRRNF